MMTVLEYETTKIKIERENEEKLKHYPTLEKQLKIAVEALEKYADERTWYCCFKNQCAYVDGFEADQALKQIKELEKDGRMERKNNK